VNIKTGILLAAAGSGLLALGGCTSVRYTQGELAEREAALNSAPASGSETGAPSHSSAWAAVLPSDHVNSSPLAMAEYNSDLDRNDAAFGVVHGPAGEPMAYYASAEPPSLLWQYQFTLPSTANTVTVFRRSGDPAFSRPFRGFYRVP
jgi:hypothetical protein